MEVDGTMFPGQVHASFFSHDSGSNAAIRVSNGELLHCMSRGLVADPRSYPPPFVVPALLAYDGTDGLTQDRAGQGRGQFDDHLVVVGPGRR